MKKFGAAVGYGVIEGSFCWAIVRLFTGSLNEPWRRDAGLLGIFVACCIAFEVGLLQAPRADPLRLRHGLLLVLCALVGFSFLVVSMTSPEWFTSGRSWYRE